MKKVFITFVLCLIACSCSTPSAPDYDPQPAYLADVSNAWGLFSGGQYGLSALGFRNALAIDVQKLWPEAYIGLGWSLAMQDSLVKAVSNFNSALQRTPRTAKDSVNALAGLGLAYRDITPPDFARVRDNVLEALAVDSQFVFEYKSSINAADLEAVLAEAYFNLGQDSLAAAIADPNGTLDPAAENYQSQLLTRIDMLITQSREGE
ncbi:MAG: hypothetical protein A3F83_04625 [Candidatus Glassbacteria bacterium RIFCSPLOWO2_12_FULL_58_11]|uniref:Uncharacterized protein n=2 Tax=Candidatus Glassiibacteriota TaxID=1817805 RepID=A0A1F5YWW5_9BACT|nr:MAG: hypothetical protein A2Z86_06790 [Candidatus Glassbacteria bacterium GWA2_58_10]OGG04457.1 MAG: hypothetical protein A3F83_04625 [Candidatus Glassbacteria bacterium RIFCSPLOWO2_12_FULL_58_11]